MAGSMCEIWGVASPLLGGRELGGGRGGRSVGCGAAPGARSAVRTRRVVNHVVLVLLLFISEPNDAPQRYMLGSERGIGRIRSGRKGRDTPRIMRSPGPGRVICWLVPVRARGGGDLDFRQTVSSICRCSPPIAAKHHMWCGGGG
jgi:hypothetical protein